MFYIVISEWVVDKTVPMQPTRHELVCMHDYVQFLHHINKKKQSFVYKAPHYRSFIFIAETKCKAL